MPKDLILQILIIILPLLLYFSLYHSKSSNKILLTVICSFLVIYCLSFPVVINSDSILDLRSVPWLISFLYGGTIPGVIVSIVMFSYRFMIGGLGAYLTVAIYVISIGFIYWLAYKYTLYAFQQKVKTVFLVGTVNVSLIFLFNYIFILKFTLWFEKFVFFSLYYVIIVGTLLFIICIIESLLEKEILLKELQRSEKQYIVGQLAASVAHEIRNPMTVIRGFLQLLLTPNQSVSSKTRDNYYQIMLTELDRAHHIINDYLSLAKPQAENVERVNLVTEINRVREMISSYAVLKGVTVVLNNQSKNEPCTIANKEKFTQVLVNILKNGIEATENGGKIEINIYSNYSNIYIDISDDGIGMTGEQIKHIGTPYYSTKEKGTGIGLMVCYNIIESMGGKITIKSEVNKGTTFTIIIPANN